MAVPGAAEMVAMGLQHIVDGAPAEPFAVLQVKVRNAFNTVSRAVMLQGAREKAPGVFNWLG